MGRLVDMQLRGYQTNRQQGAMGRLVDMQLRGYQTNRQQGAMGRLVDMQLYVGIKQTDNMEQWEG